MKCAKCSAVNSRNDRFCTTCGAELKRRQAGRAVQQKPWQSRKIAAVIAGVLAAGLLAYSVSQQQGGRPGRNTAAPSPRRGFAADVLDVAGKFRCSCGSCDVPELAACTCPTAVEEKELISRELRQGQGEVEVVRLVEDRYGGLKSRFASMLSGVPPVTAFADEGSAQSQLADFAGGATRHASGSRVLAVAADSTTIASRFICACGQCQDHALSVCDCDHPRGAVEMKAFIDYKIAQQRHTTDEIVAAVAYEYGHEVESTRP